MGRRSVHPALKYALITINTLVIRIQTIAIIRCLSCSLLCIIYVIIHLHIIITHIHILAIMALINPGIISLIQTIRIIVIIVRLFVKMTLFVLFSR